MERFEKTRNQTAILQLQQLQSSGATDRNAYCQYQTTKMNLTLSYIEAVKAL